MFEFLGNMIGLATEGGRVAAQNQQQWNMANQNYNNQKEFAQNSVLWRVQDAQRAGIHPLFALGHSGASYSPASIIPGTDNSGSYLKGMGQGVDRAIAAAMSGAERSEAARQASVAAASQAALTGKQIEKMDAEIGLINSQAARLNASQVPPPVMPSPSFGRTGLPEGQSAAAGGSFSPSIAQSPLFGGWENKLSDVPTHRPGQQHVDSGPAGPSVKWVNTGRGLLAVPSKNLGAEDEFGAPIMSRFLHENWLMQNSKPTLAEMQSAYPGAIGMTGSAGHWMPVYPTISDRDIYRSIHRPGESPQYDTPRRRAWPRRIDNP